MAIDIMILVDTSSLGSGDHSTDANPAGCDHQWAFMITDLKHAKGGNGTADLTLQAEVGDQLRIWSSSLSNQLGDEVFVYDFKHWDKSGYPDYVLDTEGMRGQAFTRSAMVPQTGDYHHAPPTCGQKEITFYAALLDVTKNGKEAFMVKFVVYGPPDATTGKRPVKGYYCWDPTISAQ